jgi:hypothetical protein
MEFTQNVVEAFYREEINLRRAGYVVNLLIWRWVGQELANIRVELESDLKD